ncbi:MAG: SUMF1/EgtB/PvdO family nonheme iron enzyme [Deltaproteobacteria bacterium]|nr:SUMF1/EgtB/PvdO family nonheme iron enzyme [Deltaproteobacteria bacterium]
MNPVPRHPALAVLCVALIPIACSRARDADKAPAAPGLVPASAPSSFASAQPPASASSSELESGIPSASASAVPTTPPSAPDAGADPGCLTEMARVGRACIDRYEAHLVLPGDGGQDAVHPYFERPQKGVSYKAVAAPGVFPQAYINRLEAEQACTNAGKRLCSLAEWYRACQGSRGFIYPYGNTETKGKCNSGKGHLLSKFFGTNSRNWKYEDHFNSPMLDQQPGFLARTGEYASCVSSYGVFDLVGNVHEWISDKVDPSLSTKIPLQEDIQKKVGPRTGNAIFMGGFFSTTSEHGKGCRFVTIGHEAKYHDYSTGFRCCRDAKP